MRTIARTTAAGLAVVLSAATLGTLPAHAGPTLPVADAGTIEVWGAAPGAQTNTADPYRAHHGNASYTAVASGGTGDSVRLAVTAAGSLQVLAGGGTPLVTNIPAALSSSAQVEGVDLGTTTAMAWDANGTVYSWATTSNRAINVTGVSGVEQADVSTTWGLLRKQDGTVQAVGNQGNGATLVPDVLTSTSAGGFVPVTKIGAAAAFGVALRSDGSVVTWGNSADPDRIAVPAGLGPVADIAVGSNGNIVAVLADGTLAQWGTNFPANQPTGDEFESVAATNNSFGAVREDGSVVVWGDPNGANVNVRREVVVPAELSGRSVAQLTGGSITLSAIVTGAPTGQDVARQSPASVEGVAQAGRTLTATPATFSGSPSVTHQWLADDAVIAGADGTTLALTADQVGKRITYRSVATAGSVSLTVAADPTATVEPDDSLAVLTKGTIAGTLKSGETLTATPATFSNAAAVLSYQWFVNGNPVEGATGLTFTLRPQDAGGSGVQFRTTAILGDTEVSDLSPERGPIEALAPLKVDVKGKITGTPRVGQVLTGTPAKFNDGSATVTRQWLVGGQPVAGATGATFTPTAAHVGKPVVLRTTATRGIATLTDLSAATANVAPATVPKASTSVAVSGATTAAYGSTVRWTVTVRGGSPAGGTVTVAGSGVNVRAAVSRGRAVVTLPRTLAPASRTLRVTYSGDGTHLASSRNLGLRVVKANVSAAAKVTKKPTSRKAGKVRVTVRGAGPVRAGGRVTVTIQKGSKRYTVRGNVRSNGTVDLTLRKLAKGTWTVKAVYAGDARYNARATGAVRVKVSK
ncbi:Ig-like domain repeat protein [Aeromicrobium sp. IC_218]|uniref:Ig-like domain repeat protein n=1 Tax=Aeromicrobium sp. IC_218 TaxID=2545468 RepID=UPI001038D5BB|nr:Ig-like domain repeat protein [Aeromicrobium sp. IC_218]TCI98986.1 hypothetical protein E0W78_09595 [Aeromicrobium sp. IC_218]